MSSVPRGIHAIAWGLLHVATMLPAAHAQLEAPAFPHEIELLPPESAATADAGHSYLFNPAGPAFTQPSSFEFYQTITPSAEHRGPGDGARGVFWSLPNYRFGLQYLMLESGAGTGVFSFSNSRLIGATFAYGTNLNYHWYRNTDELLPGNFSLRLGFMARPSSVLSVGLAFDSILSPESPIDELRSVGRLGIAVRPFGDRLTISADAESTLVSFLDTPVANFLWTLRVEPVPGLILDGTVKVNDMELTTFTSADGGAPEIVASLGVTVYRGKTSLGAASYLAAKGDRGDYAASTFYFAGHKKRRRSTLGVAGRKGVILVVTLRKSLRPPPYDNALGTRPDDFPLLFQVRRLHRAIGDKNVKAVVLKVERHEGGFADIQEIRRLVLQLREAGKPVFAYLVAPAARDIYLASACSQVVIHPAADVRLDAPNLKKLYIRGTLAKLGLEAEVVRSGAYKSAPEQLVADGPSEQTAEMAQRLVRDLYAQVVEGIAEGRDVPIERVQKWFDNEIYTASEAVRAGMADTVGYEDELTRVTAAHLGAHLPIIRDDKSRPAMKTAWGPQYRIAIVYLGGPILRGNPTIERRLLPKGAVVSTEVVGALKRLSRNPAVKAVVVRVDSPGGDFLASDEIRHAIERIHEKMPVIVSMGDTAASGGYYVSLPADVILADPATITGSIGVFVTRWNAQALLDKIGAHLVTFSPDGTPRPLSDWSRPWSGSERERVDGYLNEAYRMFLEQVSRARGLTEEETRALAGGQVWSGRQALERGLVDQLGGLNEAILLAKTRAGIAGEASTVLEVWPGQTLRETILDNMFGQRPSAITLGRSLFGTKMSEAPAPVLSD